MTPTEHSTKTPSPWTGLFALLCNVLHVKGTGASEIGRRKGSAAPSPRLALLAFALSACVALLAPSVASAAVVRPFVRAITEGSSGSFSELGGIAVDKADDLWAGDGQAGSNFIDKFAPAATGNAPSSSFPVNAETEPASIAVEQQHGNVFLTGNVSGGINPRVEVFSATSEDELLAQWGKFGESAHVAVDNSTDPLDPSACTVSACTAYITHTVTNPEAPRGDEEPPGVEKFEVNSAGEPHPAPFTVTAPYIEGNQIVGAPVGPAACEETYSRFSVATSVVPQNITVDPQGDIYVIDGECRNSTPAVLEYRPSGEFVRAITGAETPGFHDSEHGGWGSGGQVGSGGQGIYSGITLTGLAFDSRSDRLLVSLTVGKEGEHRGAVDEFEASSGGYVDQVTETTEGSPLGDPVSIAVDSHGYLYVADKQEDRIDVYEEGQLRPNLRLGEANGSGKPHRMRRFQAGPRPQQHPGPPPAGRGWAGLNPSHEHHESTQERAHR